MKQLSIKSKKSQKSKKLKILSKKVSFTEELGFKVFAKEDEVEKVS